MKQNQLKWSLKRDKLPGGDEIWTGQIELPTRRPFAVPGAPRGLLAAAPKAKSIKLKASAKSKKDAMGATLKAANKIMSNPLVADLLPPGTQSAVAVASKLLTSKLGKKATKKAKKFLKSLW